MILQNAENHDRGKPEVSRILLSSFVALSMLSIFFIPNISANAQSSCVGIQTPFSVLRGGTQSAARGTNLNDERRICYQLPNGVGSTVVIEDQATVSGNGSLRLFVPETSSLPETAAVLFLQNSKVDAASAPFITGERLPNQVSGRLRVNLVDTEIGSGRSLTFVPNGGGASPTELYIGSLNPAGSNQITYDGLTIEDATFIDIGSFKIDTRQRAPIALSLENSTITGANVFTVRNGSSLHTDRGTNISSLFGLAQGLYGGTGTFNGATFELSGTG